MEASAFYLYGLLLYIPVAVALSCVLSSSDCRGPASSPAATAPKKKKPKRGESGFPAGKCAFCVVCKRYIMRECDLKTHEEGSSHASKAEGQAVWFEFRDLDEALVAKKAKTEAGKK